MAEGRPWYDGRRFPWANDDPTPTHANFDREWDGDKTWAPIGSLSEGASPYGVKDMAGNARELVQNWYDQDYYKQGPLQNPQGPDLGVVRSIPDGSWHSPLRILRRRPEVAVALRCDARQRLSMRPER